MGMIVEAATVRTVLYCTVQNTDDYLEDNLRRSYGAGQQTQ